MSGSQRRVFRRWSVLLAFAFILIQADRTTTQHSPLWTGVAADEAAIEWGYHATPWTHISREAMTPDGRYVVFGYNELGADGETSGIYGDDLLVRDRATGAVDYASINDDGFVRPAREAAISDDGRYVAWVHNDVYPHDIFVTDRTMGTGVRASVGPAGELPYVAYGVSMSGDGRFIAFIADFSSFGNQPSAYLRDRDVNGNGIFDEPGDSATTLISPPYVEPSFETHGGYETAISPDGRYVAYIADTFQASWWNVGKRVHIYDRHTGSTVRADDPGGVQMSGMESRGLHFSAAGQLVFTTNDRLLEGGLGAFEVYVYDIATAAISKVALNHPNAPVLDHAQAPVISGDGRYVAFVGVEHYYSGQPLYNVYAVDRQTNTSYEISVDPNGQRTNNARSVAINGDGSEIAFASIASVLARPTPGMGVFVATTFSMQGGDTSVPPAGASYQITVNAPAGRYWSAQYDGEVFSDINPLSGTGRGTINVTILPNTTANPVIASVSVGSAIVKFRQEPLDTTPPVVTPIFSTDEGGQGWYDTDVTVSWAVQDDESGGDEHAVRGDRHHDRHARARPDLHRHQHRRHLERLGAHPPRCHTAGHHD